MASERRSTIRSRLRTVSSTCASTSPACSVSCPTTLDVPAMNVSPAPAVARENEGLFGPY
jgi:hypothetical protein